MRRMRYCRDQRGWQQGCQIKMQYLGNICTKKSLFISNSNSNIAVLYFYLLNLAVLQVIAKENEVVIVNRDRRGKNRATPCSDLLSLVSVLRLLSPSVGASSEHSFLQKLQYLVTYSLINQLLLLRKTTPTFPSLFKPFMNLTHAQPNAIPT